MSNMHTNGAFVWLYRRRLPQEVGILRVQGIATLVNNRRSYWWVQKPLIICCLNILYIFCTVQNCLHIVFIL